MAAGQCSPISCFAIARASRLNVAQLVLPPSGKTRPVMLSCCQMRSGETILHEISEADEYVGRYRSELWDWFASAVLKIARRWEQSALRDM